MLEWLGQLGMQLPMVPTWYMVVDKGSCCISLAMCQGLAVCRGLWFSWGDDLVSGVVDLVRREGRG